MAARTETDIAQRADLLRHHGARMLVGVVADSGGVLRAKAVPAARIEAFATTGMGASVTWPVFCVDNGIAMTDRLGVVGDLRLTADLERAVVLDDGFTWAPLDVRTQDGDGSPLCWRAVARRQAHQLAERGLSARAAFAMEFTVLDSTGRRVGEDGGWNAYGLGPVSTLSTFTMTALERLAHAGVPVEQVHAEYGMGQLEMSLPPVGPVEAADSVLLARTVLGRTARELGLMVSFSPLPFADNVGNGAHLHVSLTRGGTPVFSGGSEPADLTTDGAHAIAGLVSGLPEGIAVLAGSVVSPDRLVPDHWSGAFSCWGVENREAAVRLLAATHGNPHGANVEVKCIDGAANPYLAVGIVLGLAVDGIDHKRPLPPQVAVNPTALSDAEAQSAALRRLPDTLEGSFECFVDSTRVRQILGADLHDAVTAVRRYEMGVFSDGKADRHAMTRFAWSA